MKTQEEKFYEFYQESIKNWEHENPSEAIVGTLNEEQLTERCKELVDYANDRISRWGFDGWKLSFTHQIPDNVVGLCFRDYKEIVLNIKWMDNPIEFLYDTIIHELAHARCREKDAIHGEKWYNKCLELCELEKEFRPNVNFIDVIGIQNL
jgi:hypothetical protein